MYVHHRITLVMKFYEAASCHFISTFIQKQRLTGCSWSPGGLPINFFSALACNLCDSWKIWRDTCFQASMLWPSVFRFVNWVLCNISVFRAERFINKHMCFQQSDLVYGFLNILYFHAHRFILMALCWPRHNKRQKHFKQWNTISMLGKEWTCLGTSVYGLRLD